MVLLLCFDSFCHDIHFKGFSNRQNGFDKLEPFGIDLIAIGSGGPYAQAAATALLENSNLSARDIVEKSLKIAGDICIYTNHHQTIEEL